MSESAAYFLRWRGRQSGPCTAREINRKLDEHEIGMGHEVQYQDRWISVQEFLRLQAAPLRVNAPAAPAAAVAPMAPTVAAVAATPTVPTRTTGGALEPAAPFKPAVLTPLLPAGGAPPSPRRRMVFAILAILLGFLGVHNFYARHWLTGIIQLLVSIASLLLGFGVIASWLWAMAEAVLVHQDGEEMEMT